MNLKYWDVIENKDTKDEPINVIGPLEIRSLFFVVGPKYYPEMIINALDGVGMGFDGDTGFGFDEGFDEYEREVEGRYIPEDQVEISDPFGAMLMPIMEFYELLYDVAVKSLEVMRKRGRAKPEWEREMEDAITRLEERLGKPSVNKIT